MTHQDIENQKALFSIAREIKKFHVEQTFRRKYNKQLYLPQPIFVEWYKTSIKAKKKLIISLKKKLSVACVFAKILSMNANRNIIKTNELTQAALKCSNRKLSVTLHESVSTKLIDNTHREIFFNQDNRTEVEKLREIICHLNSTNILLRQEKEKVENLERKNRFLTTKLRLTENQLRILISQTDNLKKDYTRLTKINCLLKNRKDPDSILRPKANPSNSTTVVGEKCGMKLYLSNVIFLLNDQTKIINGLRNLSENFKTQYKH